MVIGSAAAADRGVAVGVQRTWRDPGYAVGAMVAGVLAALTAPPGVVARIRMSSGAGP